MKFENFMKNHNKEEEFNKMKKENDKEKEIAVDLLKAMYEMTGDSVLKFKLSCVEFNDLLTNLSISMNTITPSQYDELINMVSQFKEVVENYIKENNIKLEE